MEKRKALTIWDLKFLFLLLTNISILPFEFIVRLILRRNPTKPIERIRILIGEEFSSFIGTWSLIILNFSIAVIIFILYILGLKNVVKIVFTSCKENWHLFNLHFLAHASICHLLFNMFALFIFGRALENKIGSSELIKMYFVLAILLNIVDFLLHHVVGIYDTNHSAVGSSAVIFGIASASIIFSPLYIPVLPTFILIMLLVSMGIFSKVIPLPLAFLGVKEFSLNVYNVITGAQTNIDYLSHVIGFLLGEIYVLVFLRKKIKFFNWVVFLLLILLEIFLFLGILSPETFISK